MPAKVHLVYLTIINLLGHKHAIVGKLVVQALEEMVTGEVHHKHEIASINLIPKKTLL